MKTCRRWVVLVVAAGATGCVQVKPIKVEPIHITMDVNIRIDRQLEEFFEFEEKLDPAIPDPAPSDTKG